MESEPTDINTIKISQCKLLSKSVRSIWRFKGRNWWWFQCKYVIRICTIFILTQVGRERCCSCRTFT